MDPQFEELAQRLSKELSIAVTGGIASAHEELAKRITEELSGAERRLTGQYKLHSESLKEEVKLAAEGYGATLEAIRRELQELRTKWDTRINDHDGILKTHNQRITVLEGKLP